MHTPPLPQAPARLPLAAHLGGVVDQDPEAGSGAAEQDAAPVVAMVAMPAVEPTLVLTDLLPGDKPGLSPPGTAVRVVEMTQTHTDVGGDDCSSTTSSNEDDMCRICRSSNDASVMLRPCVCTGSVANVHRECLDKWLVSPHCKGSFCEICRTEYLTTSRVRPLWRWEFDLSGDDSKALVRSPLYIVSSVGLFFLTLHSFFLPHLHSDDDQEQPAQDGEADDERSGSYSFWMLLLVIAFIWGALAYMLLVNVHQIAIVVKSLYAHNSDTIILNHPCQTKHRHNRRLSSRMAWV